MQFSVTGEGSPQIQGADPHYSNCLFPVPYCLTSPIDSPSISSVGIITSSLAAAVG